MTRLQSETEDCRSSETQLAAELRDIREEFESTQDALASTQAKLAAAQGRVYYHRKKSWKRELQRLGNRRSCQWTPSPP